MNCYFLLSFPEPISSWQRHTLRTPEVGILSARLFKLSLIWPQFSQWELSWSPASEFQEHECLPWPPCVLSDFGFQHRRVSFHLRGFPFRTLLPDLTKSLLCWLPWFFFVSWLFFPFKFKLKFQPFVTQFLGQQLCKWGLFFAASGWAWKRRGEAVNFSIKADPPLFILRTTPSFLMLDIFFSFKALLGLLDSVDFKILP